MVAAWRKPPRKICPEANIRPHKVHCAAYELMSASRIKLKIGHASSFYPVERNGVVVSDSDFRVR